MISLRFKGWNTLVNTFIPYFNMLYGTKFINIQKALNCHNLWLSYVKLYSGNATNKELLPILFLLYKITCSVNVKGEIRPFSQAQEDLLIITDEMEVNIEVPNYKDNEQPMSLFWFVGFFLGDGSLYLKLAYNAKTHSIFIVPVMVITQKKLLNNIAFINMLIQLLEEHSCKASLVDSPSNDSTRSLMMRIIVEGSHNILDTLMPLLPLHYIYWKIDQYLLMKFVEELITYSLHRTTAGLIKGLSLLL